MKLNFVNRCLVAMPTGRVNSNALVDVPAWPTNRTIDKPSQTADEVITEDRVTTRIMEMQKEMECLKSQLGDATCSILELEMRLRQQKVQSNELLVRMKRRLLEQNGSIHKLREERDRVIREVSSSLLLVEGKLRKEQKDIMRALSEKDAIIAMQQKQIETMRSTERSRNHELDTVPTAQCQHCSTSVVGNSLVLPVSTDNSTQTDLVVVVDKGCSPDVVITGPVHDLVTKNEDAIITEDMSSQVRDDCANTTVQYDSSGRTCEELGDQAGSDSSNNSRIIEPPTLNMAQDCGILYSNNEQAVSDAVVECHHIEQLVPVQSIPVSDASESERHVTLFSPTATQYPLTITSDQDITKILVKMNENGETHMVPERHSTNSTFCSTKETSNSQLGEVTQCSFVICSPSNSTLLTSNSGIAVMVPNVQILEVNKESVIQKAADTSSKELTPISDNETNSGITASRVDVEPDLSAEAVCKSIVLTNSTNDCINVTITSTCQEVRISDKNLRPERARSLSEDGNLAIGSSSTTFTLNPKISETYGSYERLTELGLKPDERTRSPAPRMRSFNRGTFTNHRSVIRPRDVKHRRLARSQSHSFGDDLTKPRYWPTLCL